MLSLLLLAQWTLAVAVAACTPIRFAAGHTSVIVEGSAPADDLVCYALNTRKGQLAELKILSGANTIFGIDGLVDARDAYRFTTERKTYRIEVGQLMRATGPERFAMSVSVK